MAWKSPAVLQRGHLLIDYHILPRLLILEEVWTEYG